jgi:glycosyltransferase involved in cell wall biosynthesis
MSDNKACGKGMMLMIANEFEAEPTGGRELLSRLNHDVLKELYGDRFLLVELPRRQLRRLAAIVGIFNGHIDGINGELISRTLALIRRENISQVFIDGSNLGALAAAVKRSFPRVQVLVFFHNCEARFFLGGLRRSKSLRSLGVFVSNYFAERRAVRHSDKRVCLSKRDSEQLKWFYGIASTNVSAMAMKDKFPTGNPLLPKQPAESYALFVGGAFYANMHGISWFCRNVAPAAPLKTYVVGKGLESVGLELEQYENVRVVGEVDDLMPWYRDAQVVVAPIFDGSGMKTKVAEALMFGKHIIGTPEAFSGYEDIVGHAGEMCNDASGFISALKAAADRPFVAMDAELRELYVEHYSTEAAAFRLRKILRCAD